MPGSPVNSTLIAIIALVSSTLSFGTAWQIQSWKAQANEKRHVEQHAQEERDLHALESSRQKQLALAQSVAAQRTAVLRRDAAKSRDTIERLRSDIAAADVRIAGATHDALAEYAVAANLVLADCSKEYLRVAEAAQGHADDVRLMQEIPR